MMSIIVDGILLEVMIVVTPAPVAISAAMSFVSMPPVPRLDPSVDVLTTPLLALHDHISNTHLELECQPQT